SMFDWAKYRHYCQIDGKRPLEGSRRLYKSAPRLRDEKTAFCPWEQEVKPVTIGKLEADSRVGGTVIRVHVLKRHRQRRLTQPVPRGATFRSVYTLWLFRPRMPQSYGKCTKGAKNRRFA